MTVILIPGLWLDGSSWDRVVPILDQAGHQAHPVTLPGMESKEADRSAFGDEELADLNDAALAGSRERALPSPERVTGRSSPDRPTSPGSSSSAPGAPR